MYTHTAVGGRDALDGRFVRVRFEPEVGRYTPRRTRWQIESRVQRRKTVASSCGQQECRV